MNYSHFSYLGYTIPSKGTHSYRIVNPKQQKRENYASITQSVIDLASASDVTTFQNFLRDHPSAFVWFHATWCGHCVSMKDAYADAASRLQGKVSFIRIDADKYRNLVSHYNVQGFPTMILFTGGKPVKVYEGKRTADAFVSWLKENA
jgi:thioredoxin-like negative regulator of GroEL